MKTATRRRTVLQALGVAAATVVATTQPADARVRLARRLRSRLVFRFSTRGRSSCGACRKHHKYVVASSKALLEGHRAHPGCNCPTTRQRIDERTFQHWFPEGSGVVDLRRM